MDVLMIIIYLGPLSFQTLRPQSLFLTNKVVLKLTSKIFVHTHRRRTHSKIMLRIDSANAPVCYFHQTFGDKALSQSKVATLASGGITETRHDSVEATLPKLFHSKF